MRDKIIKLLALIAMPFKWLGKNIAKVFLKIFPRRNTKYFDADRHELKYIMLMAAAAIGVNLYMEWFARFTKGIFEGFVWAATHPVVFLFNTLIIFCTMTIALLFKRYIERRYPSLENDTFHII
ncbi:MAG: hypothetical protein Q4B78_04125 [Bacillota bacterium]|nr:hypothetical protein [Bacillota bacterium]